MHCHLIVSRKDQANKKKLSPLTNHKNTKKGTVVGGFDRVNLFRQAEKRFNELFGYNRQWIESFDFHNTMKNGSISELLYLQEQEHQSSERKIEINQDSNQENLLSINLENKKTSNQTFDSDTYISTKQENNTSTNPSFNQENKQTPSSFISFMSSKTEFSPNYEEQRLKLWKKKKKRYGL